MAGGWLVGGLVRDVLTRRKLRSAAVPFESGPLRMARVAEDERHGLVAVLRDFAGSCARYTVPWADLPDTVPMSERDAALHKVVEETKAVTPAAMREAVTQVALAGLFGPEAKAQATAAARSEGQRERELHAVLIFHLLHASQTDVRALVETPAGRHAKTAVSEAASALGIRRGDIFGRTGELAKRLLPVGFASGSGPLAAGWLRVLHREVAELNQRLNTRLADADAELEPDLRAAMEVSAATVRASAQLLGLIDGAVLGIGATVRQWETAQPTLVHMVDKLSDILDEWGGLIPEAQDALRAPDGELAPRLRRLRALLPTPPVVAHPAIATPGIVPATAAGAGEPGGSVSSELSERLHGIWSSLKKGE